MGGYHCWHEYSRQFYREFGTLGRTAKMRFVQWHVCTIDLHEVRNTFLASVTRNIGMQSVPIFLQDAAGFFLIEIQYYSSVSCLDAVIEVMDDVWFLGFVDIVSVSLNIHHLETLFF